MGIPSFRESVLNVAKALANLGSCPSRPFTVATTLPSRDSASAPSRRRSVAPSMSAPLSCHANTPPAILAWAPWRWVDFPPSRVKQLPPQKGFIPVPCPDRLLNNSFVHHCRWKLRLRLLGTAVAFSSHEHRRARRRAAKKLGQ